MRFFQLLSPPRIVGLLLLVLPVGCSPPDGKNEPESSLTLFGNVDIREVQLAFQDGGRLRSVAVDEGAQVEAGQVVAELDPERFELEFERLKGEASAQAQQLARLRNGSRPQEIEQARAGLSSARASLNEAEIILHRKQLLRQSNHISQQEVDSALARVQSLKAAVRSAEEQLSLEIAGPREEEIHAAEASLKALVAARDLAERKVQDTRLTSPADGVIRNRILEPGAMAAAGAPVLTLALTNPLWVRSYVSEPDLGRVHEGMEAELQSDTFPDKTYRGWVGFVSSTAEFTPKTVETTELRTKLVYRVRVFVCDPGQELRLGMPMTVRLKMGVKTRTRASCGD